LAAVSALASACSLVAVAAAKGNRGGVPGMVGRWALRVNPKSCAMYLVKTT
jgi:hypothetical protein